MADILIRGIEMPKTCAICKIRSCNSYCPLNINIKFFCSQSNAGFDFCTGRHSDCPLHELPEHGDLVERDSIYQILRKITKRCNTEFEHYMDDNIKIIVPSNKEETE